MGLKPTSGIDLIKSHLFQHKKLSQIYQIINALFVPLIVLHFGLSLAGSFLFQTLPGSRRVHDCICVCARSSGGPGEAGCFSMAARACPVGCGCQLGVGFFHRSFLAGKPQVLTQWKQNSKTASLCASSYQVFLISSQLTPHQPKKFIVKPRFYL